MHLHSMCMHASNVRRAFAEDSPSSIRALVELPDFHCAGVTLASGTSWQLVPGRSRPRMQGFLNQRDAFRFAFTRMINMELKGAIKRYRGISGDEFVKPDRKKSYCRDVQNMIGKLRLVEVPNYRHLRRIVEKRRKTVLRYMGSDTKPDSRHFLQLAENWAGKRG